MRTENRDKGNIRRAFKRDVVAQLGEGTPEIEIDILLWLQMQETRKWGALIEKTRKSQIKSDLLEEMLDERFDELEEMEDK